MISTEIARLQQAKADIKTAIEGKGVTVPSSALIDTYDDYVAQIQQGGGPQPPAFTGHVDTVGLTALGWDSDDIAWLQAHVWWNAADDAYWAVTPANLAFGPNGATPLTWADRATIKSNPDVRYFPKFDPSPSSDTSWNSLFQNYFYLYAIPTHGWNTANVTNISYMFYSDGNLVSIGDLSNWNTSKVTDMRSMCGGCRKLRSTGDLSGWDTSKVTMMASMFENCSLLEDVGDLSEWDTSAVTGAGLQNLFNGCTCLQSVGNLDNWDVSNVTNLQNLFNSCYVLSNVGDLSEWDVSNVTSFLNMFQNCRNLDTIGDLSGWDTSKVNNMNYMFNGCAALTDVGDLSEWDTSLVNTMVSMFNGTTNLIQLKGIKDWDVSAVTNFSSMLQETRRMTKIDLSGWDTSAATTIGTNYSTTLLGLRSCSIIKLGSKFFNFTPSALYTQNCTSWTRDSVYESLYTNQTLRNSSSPSKTVTLSSTVYDTLSAQDISDIATKNITLVRG